MRTSTKKDRQAADEKDDDFCLADTLAGMSDEELERMAEEDAQGDVSSSAYEGIPLDKAALKAGLIVSYKKVRAERTAAKQQMPTSPFSMTTTEPEPTTATAAPPAKPQPDRDVAMTYEVVEIGYRHLFGSYLNLARHFEEHGPQEDADRYNELFRKYHQEELELFRLTPAELWTHKTEVLPPLIAEAHALRKKHLGY